MRGTRLLGGAGIGAVLYVLLAPGVAHAAESDETTQSYVVNIGVERSGVTHISEKISYDFGTTPHHGIIRYIPVTYDYPPKSGYDRILKIDNVNVVATDASNKVDTSRDGREFVIKIGDADKTITGVHTYTLSYDVRGALNRFNDHVQLDWNALGTEWNVPVSQANVAVRFPDAITSVVCFQGPQSASLACTSAVIKDGVVHVVQHGLAAYEGLTVSVAAPPDSVDPGGAYPILRERWTIQRAFAVTPLTVGVGLLAAIGGLLGVGALVMGRGRDRQFVGEVPGLAPVDGTGAEEREPLFDRTPIAVEFQPPDGLHPGQVGTLLDERVDPLDVSATIVDLAVHGYLRIEEQERAHWFAGRDWTLVQLSTDLNKLLPYEQLLLVKLFEGRSEVRVSALKKTFSKQLEAVKGAMYADAVKQGFFRASPQSVRFLWARIGVVALLAAGGLTYVLARFTHDGIIGLGFIIAAIGLLSMAHRMPARTAKGRAALVRTLGFRQYIATAEANQLKFEEKEDIFSRYLPFAIVFHEADRWAKAFASIGAVSAAGAGSGVTPYALAWYVGPPGWDLGSMTDSLSSFASSTGSAMAEAPVSSGSGGSSFSGGGFGGGGGGSW